jgi:hypothetical protein
VARNNKETKDMESKKTTQRINETKRWFFEKIDKPLNKLTKERGRRSKLIKLEIKRKKLEEKRGKDL